MKNAFYIFFLFFLFSCVGGKRDINIVKSPHLEHPQKDTAKFTFVDSLLFNNSNNGITPDGIENNSHNVLIESAYMSGSAMDFYHGNKDLNIVYVKNTKVVANSSNLSEGRVVYNIPEKMKIRSTYKVLVRISK